MSDSYSTDANPSISWGVYLDQQQFIVAFERKSNANGRSAGINCLFGRLLNVVPGQGNTAFTAPTSNPYLIPGTSSVYIRPSTHANKSFTSTNLGAFDVVYEQHYSDISNQIFDAAVSATYSPGSGSWNSPNFSTIQQVSSYASPTNTRPSVVQMPDGQFNVCWTRDLSGGGGNPYTLNAVYWKSNAPSTYTTFGTNVYSLSLNLAYNTTPFFTYSQYWNYAWSNWLSNTSSSVQINTSGKDANLSNGFAYPVNPYHSINFMFASSFVSTSSPYVFQTSSAAASYFGKSSPTQTIYGRGICLDRGDLHAYYSFGNLIVDGNSIDFVDAPDSLNYNNLDTLNRVLETVPFSVNSKSKFIFAEESGFVDSIAAARVLDSTGYVNYKIELVDNETGKAIGTIRNLKLNGRNSTRYNLVPYSLNTNAIKSKTVRVKITFTTNLDSIKTALVKSYADQDITNGTATQSVSLQSLDIVTDYALNQNFPNPFNPSTMIDYQLPNDGHVTLKVYDVLGREVRTLVDEAKTAGGYEVKFDGSNLASGIYFYRVNITDNNGKNFVSTKKMLLMK